MNIDPRSFDPRAFAEIDPGTDDAAQALAEDCARAMWARDSASKSLGMRLDEVGRHRAVMTMTVRADMINGHGTCHGGLLFALADSCFGYACNGADRANVAAACDIDFLLPAHQGDVLRAEATLCARAGRTSVFDVCITGAEGTAIAVFRGRGREIAGAVIER